MTLWRSLPLIALAFLAASCGTQMDTKSPAFYDNLASPDAKVNGEVAASMISDYRRANGLAAVELDPTLTRMAEDHARVMAKLDKVTHDPGGRGLTQRLQAVSFNAKAAAENVGAGYQTLAEAFSGWRDSPSHNKNMLMPVVTKMGIATAYAPKSKYKVYWALVLAQPDER
ncbi:MAG TPA: CAP domain-containing protein [Xanthobacteraceae bacterium]|jgi:uncharacterized protein YkwD|nr:CAP domain-containing protein [Xanthobacteraceae bacterium]